MNEQEIRAELGKSITDARDTEILVGVWQMRSMRAVATKINLTPGRVCHRFLRSVRTLQENRSPVAALFATLTDGAKP